MANESISKKRSAELLGISRSSLYYVPKRPSQDESLRQEILNVRAEHPAYGYRRVALALGVNKKRVQRVMQKFGLVRKRPKRRKPKNQYVQPAFPAENHLVRMCPLAEGVVWQTDFTYLPYRGRTLYLATVIDRFSREVAGISVSFRHDSELVLDALKDAVAKGGAERLLLVHSDQGSEYLAEATRAFVESLGATPSFSARSSPWQNGHQESFYSHFKQELGDIEQLASVGHVLAEIYRYVSYYNTRRIHSALKMPPETFRLTHPRSTKLESKELGS